MDLYFTCKSVGEGENLENRQFLMNYLSSQNIIERTHFWISWKIHHRWHTVMTDLELWLNSSLWKRVEPALNVEHCRKKRVHVKTFPFHFVRGKIAENRYPLKKLNKKIPGWTATTDDDVLFTIARRNGRKHNMRSKERWT